MPPVFEFDPAKSAANKAKHGIDFVEAQLVWNDADRVVIVSTYPDESRALTIGRIAGKMWTVIVTHRAENVRIISARRSRQEEIDVYQDDHC